MIHTMEFSTEEMVKLISICNSALKTEEATLKYLPLNKVNKANTHKSIEAIEAIKAKVKATIRDSLKGGKDK